VTYYNQGVAYERAGRTRGAIQAYEQFLLHSTEEQKEYREKVKDRLRVLDKQLR
jgi:hypothetical protein